MKSSFVPSGFVAFVALVALFTVACDAEDDPSGSGGQGADGGDGSAGGPSGSGSGGHAGSESSGGSGGAGGAPECLSCAGAMTAIESGRSNGKICDEPTSTQLFLDLAQCYCGETVCGGTTGPCARVCDPEPDPGVSKECVDCVVDSFSGACQAQADACSADG